MARLRRQSPVGNEASDDSFCEIEDVAGTETIKELRSSTRKKIVKSYYEVDESSCEEPQCMSKRVPKSMPNARSAGRQIRLATLCTVNVSKLLPGDIAPTKRLTNSAPWSSSKSPAKARPSSRQESIERSAIAENVYSSDSLAQMEVEESIWCGSDGTSDDSDEELPSPRKFVLLPFKIAHQPARPPTSDLAIVSY